MQLINIRPKFPQFQHFRLSHLSSQMVSVGGTSFEILLLVILDVEVLIG